MPFTLFHLVDQVPLEESFHSDGLNMQLLFFHHRYNLLETDFQDYVIKYLLTRQRG